MVAFKCKMSGGTLEIQDGQTGVQCEYCSTQQTLMCLDSDYRVVLFDLVNYFCEN